MRIQFDSLLKNLFGLPHRAMNQQLGSPLKIVLLARFHFNCSFKFMDGRERVAGFLINFSRQTMYNGAPSSLQEPLNMLAGLGQVTETLACLRKLDFVVSVFRIDLKRLLQKQSRFVIFANVQVILSQTVIRIEAARCARQSRTKSRFLHLVNVFRFIYATMSSIALFQS